MSNPDLNFEGPVDVSTLMAALTASSGTSSQLPLQQILSQQPLQQIQPPQPFQQIQPQPQPQPEGIQEHLLYKNRLQEFTQRAKVPIPMYHTINEGGPRHAPKFRSTVVVDGKTFTSSSTFSSRKAAEQDVAKIAFEGISKSIKDCISNKTSDGGFPPIYEDRVFCKSILYEFAVKMNKEKPTYNTVKLEGVVIPVFVSSVEFSGVTYHGQPGVTKKEAEQLAARAVILSILADSGAGTHLSEIIKAKAELFAALHKRCCPDVDTGVSPMGLNSGSDRGADASKETVGGVTNQDSSVTENTVSEAVQEQPPIVLGQDLRKPIAEPVSQAICLPITFVPPSQVQPTLHGLTDGPKRKCKKKKKKANKKVKTELVNEVVSQAA